MAFGGVVEQGRNTLDFFRAPASVVKLQGVAQGCAQPRGFQAGDHGRAESAYFDIDAHLMTFEGNSLLGQGLTPGISHAVAASPRRRPESFRLLQKGQVG